MSRRVPLRAEEMQRHVGLRSLDPAIMPRGDVEQVARPERECLAVVHDDAAPPRDDEPHVLDLTTLGPRDGAELRAPLPPRLVAGAPDGEVPDLHEIDLPHLEAARLVGPVESSDDRVFHAWSPSPSVRSSARASASAATPATATVLRRAVTPLTMVTVARGTPTRSATKRTSSAFAAPSTGAAATLTLMASPCQPDTSVRRACGTTCTTRVAITPRRWRAARASTPTARAKRPTRSSRTP